MHFDYRTAAPSEAGQDWRVSFGGLRSTRVARLREPRLLEPEGNPTSAMAERAVAATLHFGSLTLTIRADVAPFGRNDRAHEARPLCVFEE